MGSQSFFSTVAVGPSRLSECSLWTNPDGPGNGMTADTNIELSNPAIQTNPESGEKFADMYVAVSMSYSDDDQAKIPRMRLSVKVAARVSSLDLDEHAARVAAIAHLYPQASAYLSTLGAMAQVNGISLMPIDTDTLVGALESAARE